MYKLASLAMAFVLCLHVRSQELSFPRSMVDTLASPWVYGRGYVNKGDSIAASIIAMQLAEIGLKAFDQGYYQPFRLDINTFPGKMEVSFDGRQLIPGEDFVVHPSSHGCTGTYPVILIDKQTLSEKRKLKKFLRKDHSGSFLYWDLPTPPAQSKDSIRWIDSLIKNNVTRARGAIFPKSALGWHVYAKPMKHPAFTGLDVHQHCLDAVPKSITLNIEQRYIPDYETRNVIAYIPGTSVPDTFLVITAHYDHLGMMGQKTVFPGANDNASGTAMLLHLARHFSQPGNEPHYSMAFMAFAGEETGLLGSEYYTNNPMFPLEQIKFLINLDMVGTGSSGMIVFNASADSLRFEKLKNLNESKQYLPELKKRGLSASSDHYYFHQRGVPAFFFLTTGDEHRHYHNIYDTRDSLPLTRWNEVFLLICDFINHFHE